jgi:hypothetical protein
LGKDDELQKPQSSDDDDDDDDFSDEESNEVSRIINSFFCNSN